VITLARRQGLAFRKIVRLGVIHRPLAIVHTLRAPTWSGYPQLWTVPIHGWGWLGEPMRSVFEQTAGPAQSTLGSHPFGLLTTAL